MAQLDISLLQFFMPVFSFLLIFAIVYAVMEKFKLLGDSKAIKLTISFSIALIFLFSTKALTFVRELIPWFVVLLVLIFIVFAMLMFMGVSEDTLSEASKNPGVYWVVFAILIIGMLVVIGKVFGPLGESSNEEVIDDEGNVVKQAESPLKVIFSAKVFGALVLLLIAVFAITNLSKLD